MEMILTRVRTSIVWLVVALVAASCQGGDTGTEGSETATGSPDAAEASVFPVTIEHRFGTTVIPEEPERVVTLGFNDQDFLVAIGVVPIAIVADEWTLSRAENGVWPWYEEALGETPTWETLQFREYDFERILILQPDLIYARNGELERGDYDKLARIAPTIAQSPDYADYEEPWEELTRDAGLALGRVEQAEQAIADARATFEDAVAAYPELGGATSFYASWFGGGEFYASLGPGFGSGILHEMGFVMPPHLVDMGDESGFLAISEEKLDLFDSADVVVWELDGERSIEALESKPLYEQLRIFREGRSVYYADDTGVGALFYSSVLSWPWLIDDLAPRMAAAIDGDPSTPAN